MRRLLPVSVIVVLSVFQLASVAAGRQNIMIGSLVVSMDYDHRQNKDQESSSSIRIHDLKQLSVRPTLTYTTETGRDKVTISIGPAITYDFVTDDYDTLDQAYSINAHRFVTRHWKLGFTDNYRRSNDASQLADSSTPLTDEYGRRAYWSNLARVFSNHQYGRGREWNVAYQYDVLRNDDTGPDGFEDYDRYALTFSVDHKMNNAWSFSLTTDYIKGFFDPPEGQEDRNDLTEYRAMANLLLTTNSHISHYISCEYTGDRYDSPQQLDMNLFNFTAGGLLQPASQLTFDYGVGLSYEKSVSFAGRWGGNGFVNTSYSLKQTTLRGGIRRGYETQNFNGTDEHGLIAYWQYDIGVSHALSRNLSGDLTLSLRDEDGEQAMRTVQYNKKTYTAAAGLTYEFWTDYSSGIRYTYTHFQSDLSGDYDDHRLFFNFSVHKELLKW